MYIQSFRIQNFKSINDIQLLFNKDLNVLTGVNNSGKTTILEAIALWSECFYKLINKARRGHKGKYDAGDFILGPSNNTYFGFQEINSVRSPNLEDIFRDRDKKNKVVISATLYNEDTSNTLTLAFQIGNAEGKYKIELIEDDAFRYDQFNKFFRRFPEPIDVFYASPVAAIQQNEDFVTSPILKDAIRRRASYQVIRNRMFRLYQSEQFELFQKDISYILYNEPDAKLKFTTQSDMQRDIQVVIEYTLHHADTPKDLALLGSGSLQVIEILLNCYQLEGQKDAVFILLDEPDSHIHRDIQRRLLEVLFKFRDKQQTFLTTHNEALIRSTPMQYLFHLDGNTQGIIKNMECADLEKVQTHFKGIYPSTLLPVIRSMSNSSGLDIINAVEADKIIFVEGSDDARVIYRLLMQYPKNRNRKFMFWVLNGVESVFSKIGSYKHVFEQIKNGQSLWDKSCLIFDQDTMINDHLSLFTQRLRNTLNIPTYTIDGCYTLEASLFTDIPKLSKLLSMAVSSKTTNGLEESLVAAYNEMKSVLNDVYSDTKIDDGFYKEYRGRYVTKINQLFDKSIPDDDAQLVKKLKGYYGGIVNDGLYYKLMNKENVAYTIKKALLSCGIDEDIDFYTLIQLVDKSSTWFPVWDFLNEI